MAGENEHKIPIKKLLDIVHISIEKVKIRVVSDSNWIADRSRLEYLTEDAAKSQAELDRVLKYYGDVPVWNLHIEFEPVYSHEIVNHAHGQYIRGILVANCYYTDCKQAYLQEKADIKHEKTRARRENKQ